MTSEKLNMSGRKIAPDLLKVNSPVYFYKPPTQQVTARLSRKAKHCRHYHGPAKVTKKIGNHSYEILYKGRTFQRDQGMIIPAKHFKDFGRQGINRKTKFPPSVHTAGQQLAEGEYVLMKGGIDDDDWYVVQIEEVLVDRIKVSYYVTYTSPLVNYKTATRRARKANLNLARFLRTWIKRSDQTATSTAPRLSRIHTDLYYGFIPNNEINQHFLVRGVAISARGKLSPQTLEIAAALTRPHHQGAGGPDDYVTVQP